MTEAKKSTHGGKRLGAGRHVKIAGLKPRSVNLSDSELAYLNTTYGGLTKAVRTLLPVIIS